MGVHMCLCICVGIYMCVCLLVRVYMCMYVYVYVCLGEQGVERRGCSIVKFKIVEKREN